MVHNILIIVTITIIVLVTPSLQLDCREYYPGCTDLYGDLVLEYNIREIRSLTHINGKLTIQYMEQQYLPLLENLQFVNELVIQDNPLLENLFGINIHCNEVTIHNNERLETIEGLLTISDILNDINVTVSNNPSLVNLQGLRRTSMSNIRISHNDHLSSLLGLQYVVTIGNILIDSNTNLSSLNGFSAQNIQNLQIIGNTNLNTLSYFTLSSRPVKVTNFEVRRNNMICETLGRFNISGVFVYECCGNCILEGNEQCDSCDSSCSTMCISNSSKHMFGEIIDEDDEDDENEDNHDDDDEDDENEDNHDEDDEDDENEDNYDEENEDNHDDDDEDDENEDNHDEDDEDDENEDNYDEENEDNHDDDDEDDENEDNHDEENEDDENEANHDEENEEELSEDTLQTEEESEVFDCKEMDCEQVCSENIGVCECYDGYILDLDNRTCVEKGNNEYYMEKYIENNLSLYSKSIYINEPVEMEGNLYAESSNLLISDSLKISGSILLSNVTMVFNNIGRVTVLEGCFNLTGIIELSANLPNMNYVLVEGTCIGGNFGIRSSSSCVDTYFRSEGLVLQNNCTNKNFPIYIIASVSIILILVVMGSIVLILVKTSYFEEYEGDGDIEMEYTNDEAA
eukprot:TRINITY_DN1836_c0_g1_i4.p1 TRINITY_DN1836_c0_g1~~TRINITY_DN1836_c0_g1_i4.p1  ORF type:complete len:629 (+),score=184.34 TRINITY_DN1836_c0_g1_i4:41-1927(+)